MDYLIDDSYVDNSSDRQLPTVARINMLKAFIKTYVRNAGGKVAISEIIHISAPNFQDFTIAEIEQAINELQSDFDAKRAAKSK